MITQDLGIATAYGYAKSKGYTGTEAEFAELMASYAEVGQTAVDAKDAAVAAKTAAQTAATTATNKASEATTAAQTATTKAGEASTSASTATSAKDTAVSASQTATTKATEATTAAATATSAKTDAVAANTAAQSAKTAAQTAQTGAETAAASVQESAAQIATNTEDITQLKSDLSDVETLLEVPVNESYSGTAEASTQAQRISDTISLKAGHVYTYTITLASASNQDVYVYLWDDTSASISSMSLSAGGTTKSKVYTASSDIDVTIAVNDMNRAINYTITIADSDQTNVIDDIQTHLNEVDDDVIDLKDRLDNTEIALEIPVDVSVSDSIRHVPSVPYPISDTFELIKGHTYTYAITLNSASNRLIVLYIYSDQDQSLSSVSVNAGQTYKSKTYTATANVTAHLMLYDSNAENEVSYTATIQDNDSLNVVDKMESNIANLIEAPIETLPSYICHTLAQRPAGTFRQGYLCLSCDDGTEGLQSYTIPMLTQKNVPCTFGLWASSSEEGAELSFQPSVILRTQEGVNAVKTAINTLGCAVAQHGNINWTDLTERELNRFFDREKEAFDALEIPVKGAICPSHCVDDRVRAIVGGRFGSVRAGYNGFLSTADAANHIPGDVVNPYIYSLTGAHSNCYSFTSYNIIDSDKTLDVLKTALNYAVSQNMVMIVYWHDWNFIDSDTNYVANREKLEAFIDYAKTTSVTFTTLDKIPTLK